MAADRTYPVLAPAAHAVHEGHRARLARELLSGGGARGGAAREALGELMLQSHASYARCGLGGLVRHVRQQPQAEERPLQTDRHR